MSASTIQRAAPYLLGLALLTPLIVAGDFLFPYIAPRTVFFRILIELGVAALIIVALVRQTAWRWRENYLLSALGAYALVVVISSTFFSFSAYVAWFSDTERMWGVVLLLHLVGWYVLLRATLDGYGWQRLLQVALGVGSCVSLYGLLQYYPEVFGVEVFQAGKGRIISTLGNSAYVAMYTAFTAFVGLFLLVKARVTWQRALYVATVVLNLWAFGLASIRGTTLGLLVAGTVVALLYILVGRSRRLKVIGALVVVVGASVVFFALQNPRAAWVQVVAPLQRIAAIELSGGTSDTRLIGWRAALSGFQESPLFGVGWENYHVVFNKYFDADYYLLAPSEPYFDRAHNAWLDVLAMTGIAGMLSFLSIFGVLAYYLYRGWREARLDTAELLIFTGAFVTYAVHLVFVFDDLATYLSFVMLAAFVEYRCRRRPLCEVGAALPLTTGRLTAVGGVVLVALIMIYTLNIKTLQAGGAVISAYQQESMAAVVSEFKRALAYDSTPSRNIVLSVVNYWTERGAALQQLTPDAPEFVAVREGLSLASDALESEIRRDPDNALLHARLAALSNLTAAVLRDASLVPMALAASERAIALSPQHLQYYYTLADTYFIAGEPQRAVEAVRHSISINSRYIPGFFHLMRAYLVAGELDKALHVGRVLAGERYTEGTDTLFTYLADAYQQRGETTRVIQTLEMARVLHPANGQLAARLMQEYLRAQDYTSAVALAQSAAEADESLRQQADYLIAEIRAGRGAAVLAEIE